MKVPLSWLRDFVDIDITPKELAEALTMSGSKVEAVEDLGSEISNVVVGRILSLEKHPNADSLQIAKVDIGQGTLQVITGADNVKIGDNVPIAMHGAKLPGGKEIKKGFFRGIESEGMMCSISELGLTRYDYPEAPENGIFILDKNLEPGTDIKEVLGLNETVLEFEITTNRPDCLSILGIARETAVTLGKELKLPSFFDVQGLANHDHEKFSNIGELTAACQSSGVSIEIKDPNLCSRYVGRVIRNVKIRPSPKWMRNRLRAAGIRPINNIVDVTNYVMLELGQPMHAFDFDKIEGKKIIVRRAKEGEVLTTLDGQQRTLTSDMLVIADADKPVAIAGIMGGANSEVSDNTTTILLESANFNRGSVRLTAKALGLRTEASSRFEKGLDVENALTAMNRAVQLIEEIGAGEAEEEYADCYPVKWQPRIIKFRPEKINGFLGTNINVENMISILSQLGLEVDQTDMTVTIPPFREDIEGEADLAEEIARFYGYNNINSRLFSGGATVGRKTLKQKVEDICKCVMNAQGLSEVYTFSLINPKALDMINLESSSKLRDGIVILNPLSEDHMMMRTTTIPSMLEVLARNYARRIPEARLFELAYIYIPQSLPLTALPEEREVLTIGLYGNDDFYSLKGIVEELFDYLGIENYDIVRSSDVTFHPGRSGDILISNKKIGVIGEIHPDVLRNYEIDTKAYIGVIELSALVENVNMVRKYKHLPKYPAVERDIAVVVRDNITVKEIENVIKECGKQLIENVTLFDVYKGEQIREGYKSVAYSITFRAPDHTLTDDEVNEVMKNILNKLQDKLDATLR